MGKGKRQRERQEAREGKGRLAERKRDRAKARSEVAARAELGRQAIENGPSAHPSPTLRALEGGGEGGASKVNPGAGPPLDTLPEHQAHMQAWREAGEPSPR